ncbi:hypothetical protein [Niveispirillum sp. BGYR6]|uniref:hypothetical protein n=1 Tax=Niveispirillum sp. BGYR6 TaxID=2971249 RepID=UPI0022B9B4C9|nr:hypothetical protein [Niveispirillum sp. BGYR6]MDG5497433.1 hypothetical protein [Niveispirillum sp. BGYR6]
MRLGKADEGDRAMRNFVLCDSNIAGTGGHYLEYALMVLTAAEAAGYRPVLVTNKVFTGAVPDGWRVIPVFEYGFWGQKVTGQAKFEKRITTADRKWLARKYSRAGLLWAAAGKLDELNHFSGNFSLRRRTLERLRRIATIRALAQQIRVSSPQAELSTNGANPQDREIYYSQQWDLAAKGLSLWKELGEARATVAALAGMPESPLVRGANSLGALAALTQSTMKSESYAQALRHALSEINLTDECNIVYPTIAYFELSGLADALQSDARYRKGVHHIVVRRDVYNGYAEKFDEQEWSVHYARTAFALLGGIQDVRVKYYTDTTPLSEQYNRLGDREFEAGPVPVDIERRGAWRPQFPKGNGRVLFIHEVSSPAEGIEFVDGLLGAGISFAGAGTDINIILPAHVLRSAIVQSPPLPQASGVKARFVRVEELDDFDISQYTGIVVTSTESRFDRFILDALEHGIPVQIMSSHPLAEYVQSITNAYHDEKMVGAVMLAAITGTNEGWHQYRYADAAMISVKRAGSTLMVSDNAATVLELTPPPEARYVRLTFRSEQAMHLVTFFRSRHGLDGEISRVDVSCGGTTELVSVIVAVPEDAGTVALSLCNFRHAFPIGVDDFKLQWFKSSELIATNPCGVLMPTMVDNLEHRYVAPLCHFWRTLDALRDSLRSHGDPVKFMRQTTGGGRRLIASYLGDARGEKGYHLLPSVVSASAVAGRVKVKSQVYYSGDYPEPECVRATALLNASSRDDVWFVKGALDSQRYAREILRSDVILIPYSQNNYISRSSGIFSEAMAAGIPVVVPAGTWMSAQLDRFTYPLHASLVDAGRMDAVQNVDIFDMRKAGISHRGNIPRGGIVAVQRSNVTFFHIAVPAGTNYLWLTYSQDPSKSGVYVQFDLSFQDAMSNGRDIRNASRVLGGGLARRYSLMERVPRGCQSVWVGIYTAYTNTTVNLHNFNVSFVNETRSLIPQTAGGVVYKSADGAEDRARHVAESLAILAADYDVYAHSAREVQKTWINEHSADTFVRMIEAPPAYESSTNPRRFYGKEW